MKLLVLAFLLTGFSVCTLQAYTEKEARKKCSEVGGSIKSGDKEGQCWGYKKGRSLHYQSYDLPR